MIVTDLSMRTLVILIRLKSKHVRIKGKKKNDKKGHTQRK